MILFKVQKNNSMNEQKTHTCELMSLGIAGMFNEIINGGWFQISQLKMV